MQRLCRVWQLLLAPWCETLTHRCGLDVSRLRASLHDLHLSQVPADASSVAPQNELQYLRVRSSKHELMVATRK